MRKFAESTQQKRRTNTVWWKTSQNKIDVSRNAQQFSNLQQNYVHITQSIHDIIRSYSLINKYVSHGRQQWTSTCHTTEQWTSTHHTADSNELVHATKQTAMNWYSDNVRMSQSWRRQTRRSVTNYRALHETHIIDFISENTTFRASKAHNMLAALLPRSTA